MATKKTSLLELGKAQLKKSDGEKSVEIFTEMVEENQNGFANELFAAKKSVKLAQKIADSLEGNARATGLDIITAERAVKLAEANVASLEEIIARRF